jgi:hypothetical protein
VSPFQSGAAGKRSPKSIGDLQEQLAALQSTGPDRAAALEAQQAAISDLVTENRHLGESNLSLANRRSAVEEENMKLRKMVTGHETKLQQQQISTVLAGKSQTPPKPTTAPGELDFPPADSDSLDGIIAHLTRECVRNIRDHKVIEVTWSGQINPGLSCQGKNAADLKADSYFWSDGQYYTKKSGKAISHTRNN